MLYQLSYASTRSFVLRTALPYRSRAGDGARTRDIKLGRLALYQLSYSRDFSSRSTRLTSRMVGEGFEPSKALAGRFTVCSRWPLGYPTGFAPPFPNSPPCSTRALGADDARFLSSES